MNLIGYFFKIFSPTGVVSRDHDDVRRFSDAASAGVQKAISIGAKSPLIACFGSKRFRQANLVTLLAALDATYVVNRTKLRFYSY
jgi:hypothetical protein